MPCSSQAQKRIIPVLCPFWLLVAMVGGGGGLGLMAVLWALLGYIVRESKRQPAPVVAPEPAVR